MTIKMEDSTRIEFGSRHDTTASFEDYLMKGKPMLHQILASYETMPARLSGYSYEGWQTYTSDKFGYSVKYPGDAAVMGADPDQMVQFVGAGHWPILTVEHVDSTFYHPPTGTDVSQWVLDLHTDYDAIGPEVMIAGLPAVHLVYESGPGWEASDEFFFIRDEQLFRILILHSDGRQDWDLYSQFLHSFTFDDETETAGSAVEGWTGTIGRYPTGSQHKYYFDRVDEQQFIVGAAALSAICKSVNSKRSSTSYFAIVDIIPAHGKSAGRS
jgi:hypothetical protein